MRIWKQLTTSLAVVLAALLLWLWLVPGAAGILQGLGIPGSVIAAIAPRPDKVDADAATAGTGGRRGGGAPLVVTRPVARGTVNDRLNAIGNGEAIRSVTVTPQVSGTITEIAIVSGQKVAQGQILARLDDREQTIALDQAKVAVKSAAEKSQLYRNIKSTVSRMDVFNAEIAEETARLAVETAEFNLKRRTIVAPIDGIVGIVPVNVGDNADTQTTIVTLDDRSEILIDFWVPERFIAAVKVAMPAEATAVAQPGKVFAGTIEAVDNRVDTASRTMRVRARIGNDGDVLRAGMSFAVTMRFPGDVSPAIDPLAVQWDFEGAFAWRIAADKAEKVPLRVIQRNPELVLVQADLKDGEAIAIEGLLRLRPGVAVRLSDAPPAKAEAKS